MVWQSGRHGNPFFSLLYPAGSGDIRGSTCSHHGLQTNMPTLGFGPHYQQASVLFLSFCVSSALSYSTTQISASPFWLVTLCFYFSAWLPGQHGDPLVPWESGKDGEQMVTKAQWGSLKTVSALGALLSQMHRDGCILSQLKGKVDEDTTGFPCRTHTPLSSQTFNFFPACISSHFLWMGAAAAQHSDSHSQEVKCRMQTGWIPWGLESLSPALIVSDVSSDTSWVSTSPLLLGVIKCLDLWMCSCVLCRQGIKDVRTLKKKIPEKKRDWKTKWMTEMEKKVK